MSKIRVETGTFPDIDRIEIQFECPNCRFTNLASLRQIRLGETIICSGCHASIRLEDKDVSTHKARESINHAFQKLKNAIDDFNRG